MRWFVVACTAVVGCEEPARAPTVAACADAPVYVAAEHTGAVATEVRVRNEIGAPDFADVTNTCVLVDGMRLSRDEAQYEIERGHTLSRTIGLAAGAHKVEVHMRTLGTRSAHGYTFEVKSSHELSVTPNTSPSVQATFYATNAERPQDRPKIAWVERDLSLTVVDASSE
jgi:hypothetical protein